MTQPTNVHVPGPLDDDDTQKAGKDIKTGQRVSWSSSGGTARGIVRSLHRDGAVPGIPVKITGTEEEPAARIELIDEDGKPRGQFVGHKLDTLRVLKAEEIEKAEYQGEQVTLNKPFRLPKGSSKKFGVYVKDGDKVKRVTFGDPNMEIRRDDAQARANFRSRHSCDTATDKTSARYWSCRMWEAGSTVSDVTKASGAEPIYMYRPLLNAEELVEWARGQGFGSALMPDDMHATVVYSKRPFSPYYSMLAREEGNASVVMGDNIVVTGGARSVVPLGDKGAVVLKFESEEFQYEHRWFEGLGASWDYPDYLPHVSITYRGATRDVREIEPFTGTLVFGPLRAKPIVEEWSGEAEEIDLQKRQMSDDSFTTREEATARSYDLGFDGEIHTHETADGQRVFMPGATHDAYLGREADGDESPDVVSTEQGLLERTITAIMGSVMEHAVAKSATILKADEETRMVYGWASVATVNGELVVDQQGDTLEPSEMVKMADGFMASVRTAKAMHQGAGIGEVLHSMPLTNDIMKAFGISCDREGWLVGMLIHDDATFAKVKSGELSELSIGGRAGTRERIA